MQLGYQPHKIHLSHQYEGRALSQSNEIKFELSETFTHAEVYIKVKDFSMSGLIKTGDIFKGRAQTQNEVLSSTPEIHIGKEWLEKINHHLPTFIQKTRGHLFNKAHPTIACMHNVLCDQMSVILAELANKDELKVNYISVGSHHQLD